MQTSKKYLSLKLGTEGPQWGQVELICPSVSLYIRPWGRSFACSVEFK